MRNNIRKHLNPKPIFRFFSKDRSKRNVSGKFLILAAFILAMLPNMLAANTLECYFTKDYRAELKTTIVNYLSDNEIVRDSGSMIGKQKLFNSIYNMWEKKKCNDFKERGKYNNLGLTIVNYMGPDWFTKPRLRYFIKHVKGVVNMLSCCSVKHIENVKEDSQSGLNKQSLDSFSSNEILVNNNWVTMTPNSFAMCKKYLKSGTLKKKTEKELGRTRDKFVEHMNQQVSEHGMAHRLSMLSKEADWFIDDLVDNIDDAWHAASENQKLECLLLTPEVLSNAKCYVRSELSGSNKTVKIFTPENCGLQYVKKYQ